MNDIYTIVSHENIYIFHPDIQFILIMIIVYYIYDIYLLLYVFVQYTILHDNNMYMYNV